MDAAFLGMSEYLLWPENRFRKYSVLRALWNERLPVRIVELSDDEAIEAQANEKSVAGGEPLLA